MNIKKYIRTFSAAPRIRHSVSAIRSALLSLISGLMIEPLALAAAVAAVSGSIPASAPTLHDDTASDLVFNWNSFDRSLIVRTASWRVGPSHRQHRPRDRWPDRRIRMREMPH
jgi:hypothetical protein